jgi:hypothetical protein
MSEGRRSSSPHWLPRCGVVGLLVLLGLSNLVSASALAGEGVPVDGTFSVTPARRYVVARPPLSLTRSTLANTTQVTLMVRVYPVLLSQLSSGAFAFDPTAVQLVAARRVLAVGPTRFTLPPGASRQVGLRWRGLPARVREAAVGLVYQAVPVQKGSPVHVVERLLGVNILRLPGHYRQTGRVSAIHVTQLKPGTLRFTVAVANTGQAVAGPSHLVLTVRRRSGALLLRRRLASDIILPGVTRSFVLDLPHRLAAGAYVARVHVAFGSSHRLAIASAFRLVGPNQLPTDHLQIGPLVAEGSVGSSAQVKAALSNTGTAAGSAKVQLSLYRLTAGASAQQPIATRRVAIASLAPAQRRQLKSGLGHLRAGSYRLVASYEDADGIPRTLVADFQAHQPLGLIPRLRRISVEHALLIPALLLLSLTGCIALLLVRERQLKRALRPAGHHGRDRARP